MSAVALIRSIEIPPELIDIIILYYTNALPGLLHLRTLSRSWKMCVHRCNVWIRGDLTFYCPKAYFLAHCPEYRLYHAHLPVEEFYSLYLTIHSRQNVINSHKPSQTIEPFNTNIFYSKVFSVQLSTFALASLRARLFRTVNATHSYHSAVSSIADQQSSNLSYPQTENPLTSLSLPPAATPPQPPPRPPPPSPPHRSYTEQEVSTQLSHWYLKTVYRRYHELWRINLQWNPTLQKCQHFYDMYFNRCLWMGILYPKIVFLVCLYLFLPLEELQINSFDCSNVSTIQIGFLLLDGVILLYGVMTIMHQFEFLLFELQHTNSLIFYINSLYFVYGKISICLTVGLLMSFVMINAKTLLVCSRGSGSSSFPWVACTIPVWIFFAAANFLAICNLEKRSLSRMIFVLTSSLCIGFTLICCYYDGVYIISSIGLASIPLYPTCVGIFLIALLKSYYFMNNWICLCVPLDPQIGADIEEGNDFSCFRRGCKVKKIAVKFATDLYEEVCCLLMLGSMSMLIVEGFYGQVIIEATHCSPVMLVILFLYGLHGTISALPLSKLIIGK